MLRAGWPHVRRLAARPDVSRAWAMLATERIGGLSAAISSVEYLRGASQLDRFQYNDRELVAGDHGGSAIGRLIDAVRRPGTYRAIHASRVVVGALLLSGRGGRWRALGSAHLALTSYAVYRAEPRGLDGADEVALMVQSAAALGRVRGRDVDADDALWFLAGQSMLAYSTSGLAKLIGTTWTSGDAVTGVIRTRSHGHEASWRFLRVRPRLGRLLSKLVVGTELLLPVLLIGGRFAKVYVGLAHVFHVANGLVMGLGRFTFAFAGMYPAVLYTSSRRAAPGATRLLGTAGVGVAGLVGVALTGAAARHRTLGRGVAGLRSIDGPAGERLRYLPAGEGNEGPVVVIEPGLATHAAHLRGFAEALAGRGLRVVVHHRPGYLPGRPRAHPTDLATMRRELAALAAHVTGSEGVVLVGHSLGGAVALRAAADVDRLVGVVALDPSHFEHRDRLGADSQLSARAMRLTVWSLRLGLGSALEAPVEFDTVGPERRRTLIADYRHPTTWTTVNHELRAHLDAPDPGPPTVQPVLVVTSGGTAAADPLQLAADQALGADGRHVVLEGCSHLGMVLAPDASDRLAELIATAVAEASAARTVAAETGATHTDVTLAEAEAAHSDGAEAGAARTVDGRERRA